MLSCSMFLIEPKGLSPYQRAIIAGVTLERCAMPSLHKLNFLTSNFRHPNILIGYSTHDRASNLLSTLFQQLLPI